MNKEYISIFKPQRARKLIRLGYVVRDIKPDKKEPEKEKSIFIFENTEEIQKDIENLINQGF